MVPLKLCFALNRIKMVVKMYKIYNFNDLFGRKNYNTFAISLWNIYVLQNTRH